MSVTVTIFKKTVRINEKLVTKKKSPIEIQKEVLKKLVKKAESTLFGQTFFFDKILLSEDTYRNFRNNVPIYDYETLFSQWWKMTLKGQSNITWPGKPNYYALSSGTSNDTSKRIPVTFDMIRCMRRAGVRQYKNLAEYDLPDDFFKRDILMLGGCTDLTRIFNRHEGDLSGIMAKKLPFWLKKFYYKPGKKIAAIHDWEQKLEAITEEAKDWDINVIVGVPAWIQLLMERIIKNYQINNIHEIWPNLKFFVHGGVAFEPYKKGFEKLLGKEIHYMETYLASEGFIAYQKGKGKRTMKMVLDNGIFYEFIPFTDDNFDVDGAVKKRPEVLTIDQVEEGKDYALLMTTCSGAWRYMIGDTVKFTNLDKSEIIITGRTKHYLSLCGEHMSIDNMNTAIRKVEEEMNLVIPEFCVAGESHDNGQFTHQWYIGSDKEVDEIVFSEKLDLELKKLNDDYATERKSVLKSVKVNRVPTDAFYGFMKKRGKFGGQHKFPRVLKDDIYKDWKTFLSNK